MAGALPRPLRAILISLWNSCTRLKSRQSVKSAVPVRPVVHFDGQRQAPGFSVRRAFSGKQVMLIGVTGFIGKVWLANTLLDLPEVKRIYLLIRRQKSNPGERRFEKMMEDSPVFDPLFEQHGDSLPDFLREKIEVVEGDVTQPGLGLAPATRAIAQAESGSHHQQFGIDRFQSRPAGRAGDKYGRCRQHSGVRSRIRPRRPAASLDLLRGGRAGWTSQREADSELQPARARRITMPNKSGIPCNS